MVCCVQGHVMGLKMGLSAQYSVSHSAVLLLSGDFGWGTKAVWHVELNIKQWQIERFQTLNEAPARAIKNVVFFLNLMNYQFCCNDVGSGVHKSSKDLGATSKFEGQGGWCGRRSFWRPTSISRHCKKKIVATTTWHPVYVLTLIRLGTAVAQWLRCWATNRRFDSRWCHWNFSLT